MESSGERNQRFARMQEETLLQVLGTEPESVSVVANRARMPVSRAGLRLGRMSWRGAVKETIRREAGRMRSFYSRLAVEKETENV